MTATVTDLFCGAGGSSEGARTAGMTVVMAANHWQTAIDVHQVNHPDTGHDCADVSQVDPRRYPRTDVLLASPECTNHSQARGVSRRQQDPTLWDAPDPTAERSRATMWDVVRFAEQLRYDAVVVENVVEATKWVLWPAWVEAMRSLGYEHTVISHNSMHHRVPQSRDRIYVVWWRAGLKPNLELELEAWCPRCAGPVAVRQVWKNGRTVGRYRQQWVWSCTTCSTVCEPATEAAASIIDWELDCPRIGDRARPLAEATRARILAGLRRYGWAPITTAGAGNVWEGTPGMRAKPVTAPVPAQTTTAQTAVALPPGFLFQAAHGGRASDLGAPHPTVCASDDRQALVMANTTNCVPRPVEEPITTVVAGTQRHALVVRRFTSRGKTGQMSTPVTDPLPTAGASGGHGLLVPLRRNGRADSTETPVPTVTAGGQHHGLLMRNNSGGAEMVTPADEPARTVTTAGHQSLLMPYYGSAQAQPVDRPVPTVPTRDRFALVDPDDVVDDCGFRMLEPYEIAAAMSFPAGYIPRDLVKRDQVKLAGNAVTPPVMAWITGRLLQALEAAS
ncbi:DNA cytosine methyltransferase [Iamia sp.]|uniref:DNA cytosine methyltransferase n=1 Tax=Iamia sp. TaxID=2722710 RepID=UPI002C3B864A|nr:DNA cytosine methyltransferase [Iamia sp.]HXH58450.1 DNA cytosine methyltransferase [Iamia sp.]